MIQKLLATAMGGMMLLTAACTQSTPKPPTTLQEDDPGWDCHTMGNRICGENIPTEGERGTICLDSAMTVDCHPLAPNPDFDSIQG